MGGEYRCTLTKPFLLRLRQVLCTQWDRPQLHLATPQFFFDTALRFIDHRFPVGQRLCLLLTEEFPRRRRQVIRPGRHRSQRFLAAVQLAANLFSLRFQPALRGVDQLLALHEGQYRTVLVSTLELPGAQNVRAGYARAKHRLPPVEVLCQPALGRRDDQLALRQRR